MTGYEHRHMGWTWVSLLDWSRATYPEITAVMRTPFGTYLVETAEGWYIVTENCAVNRRRWQGLYPTWRDAATVCVAQHALGE